MGSEGSRINDGSGFQPSEPKLCAKGCGFFGSATTMNLCSKCYRDVKAKEEQDASSRAATDKMVKLRQPRADGASSLAAGSSAPGVDKSGPPASAPMASRCSSCKRKVGVLGFQCRCGYTFCGAHRHPEEHACSFDFKALGRDAIAEANPVVKADKIQRL